jgi:ATP-dependent exoDNAse (exonuclease V) alpha subunit
MAINKQPSAHVLELIAKAKATHLERLTKQQQQQATQVASTNSSERSDPGLVKTGMVSNKAAITDMATPLLAAITEQVPARLRPTDSNGLMTFNKEQQAAIEMALQGKSFTLIGAAGTGKTTVTQEIISLLQRSSRVLPLSSDTKHLDKGAPGIVIVGYTNKAVNNIKKKLPSHLQGHCITMHKLIEFAPNYFDIPNPETGGWKTTMRFEPAYNEVNKLPHISTLIFEESSMIGTDLYGQVLAALPSPTNTQMIFLGDLNQLPPVFGPSILGFKLAELPIIELTHVYRQALLSPNIRLATAIRTNSFTGVFDELVASKPLLPGAPLTVDNGEHGIVTIHPWKKRCTNDTALTTMKAFLPIQIANGNYNPNEDMILCPFNKSFGTVELNKIIADHLGHKADQTVFEVIARYIKSYWAVGDRVMVDRHEATITKIEPTIGYVGKLPQTASKDLTRWGANRVTGSKPEELTADEVLNQLDALGADTDDNTKNMASHTITVYLPDLDETRKLSTSGEINNMTFGYCLTVHKSQGSEWKKVFILLHNSHATMISRELIYTAVTRARESLYIICEGDIKPYKNSLTIAAGRGVIPGTSLSEKIEYFAGKKSSMVSMANGNS